MSRTKEHYFGCLIGGAIGDALGAPVEFMSYEEIQKIYGLEGIKDFVIEEGQQKAKVTDDTQMTLFTAEGLIRGLARAYKKGIPYENKDKSMVTFRAYLRWLHTQGLKTPHWDEKDYDGWLMEIRTLHNYRNPEVTTIATLGKGIMGTTFNPINNSKECGGLMRIAPVALFEEESQVFKVGCDLAAITHGHPTAYLAAGALAQLINQLIEGKALEESVWHVISLLKTMSESEECVQAILKAIDYANKGESSVARVEALGKGFVAEEALSIAIYAALSYSNDYKKAVLLAVNHGGKSDTTGSITGNIMGALLGSSQIEASWKERVELREEINVISKDLEECYQDTQEWHQKYPAW